MCFYYPVILALLLVLHVTYVDGQTCGSAKSPIELNATNIPQYFTSTNYPGDYAGVDCYWLITTSATDKQIILNIEDFHTEGSSPKCSFGSDDLNVYDGADNTATLLGKICGDTTIDAIVSSGSTLYLHFDVDAMTELGAFNVLYFAAPADATVQPECGGLILTATSTPQWLFSSNLPNTYDSDFNCEYSFATETPDLAVRFTMLFMDIEYTENCTNDYLAIYGVSDGTTTLQSTSCTRADVYTFDPIYGSGDTVILNFTTNTDTNYYGFVLAYDELFMGINVTRPSEDEIIELVVAEDLSIGSELNTTNGLVELELIGASGTLKLIFLMIYPNGSNATTTLFSLSTPAAATPLIYYIVLAKSLDYEELTDLTLLITMSNDPSSLSVTRTFTIQITDVDDNAPVLTNLPADIELTRSKTTGFSLFTVTANDSDATTAFSDVVYKISAGDTYSLLAIDETTGEITVTSLVSATVPITVTAYVVTIEAYSQFTNSSLLTSGTLNITIPPDSAPVCTDTSPWADFLDVTAEATGRLITYPVAWNCTDEYNITYSLGTVTPTLTTPLFTIDSATSDVSLLRSFDITEVPNRLFSVIVVATDSLGQTTDVTVLINVTALACFPNPRRIYARMDGAIGGVILNDFNCTSTVGLTYSLIQYPPGTFDIEAEENGTASIILKAPVYKLRFYTLIATIFDGVDTVRLEFLVTIRTKVCGINDCSRNVSTIAVFVFVMMAVCGKLL